MRLLFTAATDTGRLRPNNEDAVLTDAELGLAVLADGMGGYQAGEVASRLCCEAVQTSLRADDGPAGAALGERLRRAIEAANQTVYDHARHYPAYRGMATTVVAVLIDGARLAVGHVGDSRLYRLRQGQLVGLTRDHTLVQEQVDAGVLSAAAARAAQHRNLVTRAVGVAPWVDITLTEHVIAPGDTYLLCSDGLHDGLTDAEITRILCRAGPPAQTVQALIDAANAAGGHDNIAVVLIHCVPAVPPEDDACPR
ncbi:putative protein phosphatase 2C-type [Tepidimonas thermarum]|uniref:PPM-type phosphatase domain-containing protein n=1 Tax=Tepidimonas thermarum TaxID=335431 RepID=A0A554X4J4_9BURK|nr:Stp1/IreP family PP2C-type Ser/Thr phosphatase [Tepidimonas thermarum]TSE30738.1 putative protein phosphatase 2C-type [Tepidimonas thermarum]